MTPMEAAAEAAIPREWGSVTPTPGDYETARRVITAFLEAAAGDEDVSGDIGYAVARANAETFEGNGKAAILALKDAVE